ncbi:MAG TPA: YgjV family protein [Gemmatimonadales bacterium]|nr:YgjV family protein [Gemmatimonadales bacterium]
MRATDWLGWVATAVFLASYACKDQSKLRRIQAAAALVWVWYGVLLQALPLIVANLLVAAVAVYSSVLSSRTAGSSPQAPLSRADRPDLSRIS